MMLIHLLSNYRKAHKLSLRKMAKLTGISYSTLFRLEHGHSIQHEEWAKLWRWLLSEFP